jgi:hypothetical protein
MVDRIEAVLTSPVASAMCWHVGGGTGLSTRTVRVGPGVLAAVPWPAGDLAAAIDAMLEGDPVECGRRVTEAYGIGGPVANDLLTWWAARLPRRA